jgi:ABC-type lipoprotein release transport system permease subunit
VAGATWLLVRSELRQRGAAYLAIVLVVALGGGSSLGAFVVAYRTDRAYPDYVDRARVAELVVNPSIASQAADEVIRGLPGVNTVHSDATLVASVRHLEPAPAAVLLADENALIVRGSTDGRYIAVDQPVVTSGRFATNDGEVFVNDEYRPQLEQILGRAVHVGDELDISFWWGSAADADYAPDELVSPIGVERLRISGFGRLADEVLPDELYPRQRLIVSPDVAARYDCVGDLRADMSADEAFQSVTPPGCARDYRYYSLQLDDDASLAAIREAFNDSMDRLTAAIPPELVEGGASYYFVTLDRTVLDHAVGEATRPTVISLVVFGVMAAFATISVAALMIARTLQRGRQSDLALRAIGFSPRRRAWNLSIPPLLAGAAGIADAIVIAVIVSPVGPVGSARSVAPSPGFSAPLAVMAPAVTALAVIFSLVVFALASVAVARNRREQTRPTRVARSATVFGRVGHPAAMEGMRAALGTRRGTGRVAVLAGLVGAMAGIVATAVFGANLITLVNDPPRYGWPWDVAVITGGGYGDTVGETVRVTLDDHPAVADYGFFAFDALSRIDDEAITTIYGFAGEQRVELPIVRGRNVQRAGEAVVGAHTAEALGIAVGDRVTVESTLFDVGDIAVVGVAVLPALGPFLADRTGLGSGAFVLLDADPFDESNPAALTAIRLRDGTDRSSFLRQLEPTLTEWDAQNWQPYARSTSVKPPEIVNVDGLLSAPLVLGALLGLALMIGLPLAIVVSVRDRQRELAILRSLGFSSRDLRTTVRWQAATIVAVGALFGVPLGVVAGRLAWNRFAERLGLVPRADIPYLLLALVIVAIVVITLLGALPPARTATRISPTEVLRESRN